MTGAALLLAKERLYAAFAQSPGLQKFVQPLRRFGMEIPIAAADTATYPGVDYYRIAMREYSDTLHPQLAPTALRGYGNFGDAQFKHLGGAIVATKGRPVRVTWVNELDPGPPNQLGLTGIPVDMSVVDPYKGNLLSLGNDRAVPHLHGGLVPGASDGGPFHWFSNGHTVVGPSASPWLLDSAGNSTYDFWYPNNQTGRLMWYHDHAVGITRLNAYAGLATGYVLVDPAEGPLLNSMGVHAASQHILVVQDKIFQAQPDPITGNQNLWYPNFYDTQFFGLFANTSGLPFPDPSLVPEFWGDTMLVNGTVYPYVDVEPRRYRIRLLNACNTRFLSLRLVGALGRKFPDNAEPDLATPGPVMTQIGTEGGFLDGTAVPNGVVYNNTAAMPLVVGPGERVDLVIDFSKVKVMAGKEPLCFILHNDAPVPFPGGTPLADFHPKNKKLVSPPAPGFGPNTRTLLQFRVVQMGTLNTEPDPTFIAPLTLPAYVEPAPVIAGTRDLALYETIDEFGRLAQNLGQVSTGPLAQTAPATEILKAGTFETWNVFNTTADTHPMHFHYVNVRVQSRQPFNWQGGVPNFTGQPLPPDPGEQGWKETVRMNPGECTTLLVEIPPLSALGTVGAAAPNSPRPDINGQEYVWHCHILEHEEHDMMRPLVVTP